MGREVVGSRWGPSLISSQIVNSKLRPLFPLRAAIRGERGKILDQRWLLAWGESNMRAFAGVATSGYACHPACFEQKLLGQSG